MNTQKTKFSTVSFIFISLILLNVHVQGQITLSGADEIATHYAPIISPKNLHEKLAILSSDSLQGRETGTLGAERAAYYIQSNFKAYGLLPPVVHAEKKNSYFMPIPLKKWVSKIGQLSIRNLVLETNKDFIPVSRGASQIQDLSQHELILDFNNSKDSLHSLAFKNIDIKDKIVILIPSKFSDDTVNVQGMTTLYNYFRSLRKDLNVLVARNPKAIFVVSSNATNLMSNETFNKYQNSPLMGFDPKGNDKSFGIFLLSPKACNKILSLVKQPSLHASNKAKPLAVNTLVYKEEVHLSQPLKVDEVSASNVLGFMEGKDLKDEVLVISAHYDHLGIQDGKIYHGADDDGSGTAALLNVAEAFSKAKKEGHGPRRSILFLANVGEEKGLLGSYYYSEHPIFPIQQTITDLNIDMIGRIDREHQKDSNYVYVIGSGKLSTGLQSISESINKKFMNLNMDYTYDSPKDPNQFYYRSDHYNFARLGIPIIFYFNGVHEDYHQPTDVIEKINFGIYSKRAQLVFYTAWDLANRDDRPKVDRKSDFDNK